MGRIAYGHFKQLYGNPETLKDILLWPLFKDRGTWETPRNYSLWSQADYSTFSNSQPLNF